MKTIIATLLLLATSVFARAAGFNVTLAWTDPNPAGSIAKYTIYEQTAPTTWTKVQDVPGALQATIANVPAGVHTYAVTAVASWGIESVRSPSAIYTSSVVAPDTFKVITVVVSP